MGNVEWGDAAGRGTMVTRLGLGLKPGTFDGANVAGETLGAKKEPDRREGDRAPINSCCFESRLGL